MSLSFVSLQVLVLLSVTIHVWPQETCPKGAVHTCADCINSGPYCAWCKFVNYTKQGEPDATRCNTRAMLEKGGCSGTDIIYPQNSYKPIKQKPLTNTDKQGTADPVQVFPQEIKLELRPGLPQTIQLKFKRAEGYPVDLYYLMDLSNSMHVMLNRLKTLGGDIVKALQAITGGAGIARIGFGSFVDKTVLPFTNTNKEQLKNPCPNKTVACQPPFGYHHILSLTNDYQLFNAEVSKQNISGNLDTPEGSLDAIMQAAACEAKIGWGNATRLLVVATDAGFHMAGDGKLAAILEPNDETCHLRQNIYSKSNLMDYPSVGQIARTLHEKNIQPIFAVTSAVTDVYQELSQMIPKSEVGELSLNSDNVVALIKDAYKRLSSKIIVTHDTLPDNVEVKYSDCTGGPQVGDQGICENVPLGKEITFNINVTAHKCMNNVSFYVGPRGFNEKMMVTISTRCECECDDPKEENHPHCNGQGEVKCGTCKCNKAYTGQRCECDQGNRDDASLKEMCRMNSTTECEGRGECVCGRCQCYTNQVTGKPYYSKYCECDDDNCNRHHNKLCAGNGDCKCGKCSCYPGYEGLTCECKKSTELCKTGETICNGRGNCTCNKCNCGRGYQEPFCATCPGCMVPCDENAKCIQCLGFFDGPYAKNCSESCKHLKATVVERLSSDPDAKPCEVRDSENCWITFTMKELEGFDNYVVEIVKERKCVPPPNIIAIVAGSVAGVALIGLLILLIIKALLYARDLKEWKKFENERKKTKWANADNPLFKEATTTVTNPTFSGE